MGRVYPAEAAPSTGHRRGAEVPGDSVYVVVAYDADPAERENLRARLMPHLHWVQGSVFAGELTRTAAEDLYEALRSSVTSARVSFWLFDRAPDVRQIGTQDERESQIL